MIGSAANSFQQQLVSIAAVFSHNSSQLELVSAATGVSRSSFLPQLESVATRFSRILETNISVAISDFDEYSHMFLDMTFE